jgi:hypothetical protein
MTRKEDCEHKNPVAADIMRQLGPAVIPPARVLLDRDRRINAPETIATSLCGDPKTPRWNSNAAR